MLSRIEIVESLNLPLAVCGRLATIKTKIYVEIFELMGRNGGWLPYPERLIEYLNSLGATHWADLFFREGAEKYAHDNADIFASFQRSIVEQIPGSCSLEDARQICIGFLEALIAAMEANDPLENLIFGDFDFQVDRTSDLSPEESKQHCDFWIGYHVQFFNDLSLATHGESIFSLVKKATEDKDDSALVKAIQIDRSLLPYFQSRLWHQSMAGNSDFFDSLAYRASNPPLRGVNEYPLLWIFLNDLHRLGCLRKSITGRQILDEFQKAISSHPKYFIEDELTVQRQRRKFMKMYRQLK